MFLKLTCLEEGTPVLVNADFVSVVVSNPIGRSVLTWEDPDLPGLTVKESLEAIWTRLSVAP